jgi:hypothetical protein
MMIVTTLLLAISINKRSLEDGKPDLERPGISADTQVKMSKGKRLEHLTRHGINPHTVAVKKHEVHVKAKHDLKKYLTRDGSSIAARVKMQHQQSTATTNPVKPVTANPKGK